jgi:hypothetical protein
MAGAGLNEQRVSLVKHGGLPDPDRPGHQQDGNHVGEAFHMIRSVAAALDTRPNDPDMGLPSQPPGQTWGSGPVAWPWPGKCSTPAALQVPFA